MKLRKLNNAGIKEFEDYLDQLKEQPALAPPKNILTDPLTSEIIDAVIEIEERKFANRFELAKYLDEKLIAIPSMESNKGFWPWLSLYYFEILCPADVNGRRNPHEKARWIPAFSDFRKYYRHLLAGPYRIYRAHIDKPERALALLCGPIHKPGDIVEQLASRQELVTNKAVMEIATRLYINPKTGTPRKGAAGKSGGSARRLAEVLNQFDVTWDLYSMSSENLQSMLPKEFNKFAA